MLTGEYPGDGKEKPVIFPPPESIAETRDDLPYLTLPALLELKLASGMTAPQRLQDLADAIQLIRANKLPVDFALHLNPYVHEKFSEMWHAAQIDEDY